MATLRYARAYACWSAAIVLVAAGADGQTGAVRPRVTQAVDPKVLVTLSGNTHPLARAEFDRGLAADNLPLGRMLMVLQRSPEQETALRQLLEDQQVPSSGRFHQWVTPDEFGTQFGPADSDVKAVTDWLTGQGFQVNRVSKGKTVVEFDGSAGLVRQAFKTEIHKYAINGEEHWANASDPQIPAALAPVVAGLRSLNSFFPKPLYLSRGVFKREKTTGKVHPRFTVPNSQGTDYYALGPADLGTIYDINPLWKAATNGQKQTIGIVADSNIDTNDIANFISMFGLSVTKGVSVVLDGPDPGILSDLETEADTDAEWALASAPGAMVDLVVSESTETTAGTDLSALYIIDQNQASILNESYGACEADLGASGNTFESSLWEQGAAQGITIFVATGDNGSAGCDYPGSANAAVYASHGLAVSGVASTPFNVAVGGTDFDDGTDFPAYWNPTNTTATLESALSYIPETTWNDSCAGLGVNDCTSLPVGGASISAGSGGASNCSILTGDVQNPDCVRGYAKPAWQTGTGVPSDKARDLPDVSLFASNGQNMSFYVVCEADAVDAGTSCNGPLSEFLGIGGTSVSTPVMAGIMAIVNQSTGERQGNANYIFYPLAARKGSSCTSDSSAVSNSSCIFYDVVTGNNSVACLGPLDCGPPNYTTPFGVMVTPGNPNVEAWTAGAGYDLATGLGSVNAANLVKDWTSVSFAPTSTALTNVSPTTVTHGQPMNVTVTVSSKSGMPTGTVALTQANGSSMGIADLSLSKGVAAGTTTFLPGGTYSITATYGGDGIYGASSSTPAQVTVTPEASKTQVGLVTFDDAGNVISSNATTVVYAAPYILRVNVSNASGQLCASESVPCPTGTVSLTDNGAQLDLGSYRLNSQGYFEDQPIQLNGGTYTVVATYGGDASYKSSTGSGHVTVSPAGTEASFNGMPPLVQFGSSTTLSATVVTQTYAAIPTGSVTFLLGHTPLAGTVSYSPIAPSSSNSIGGFAGLQATLQSAPTASGNLTITYSGDSNYSSSSASTGLTVTAGVALALKPATITIASPGQSGSTAITATYGGGLAGTMNFTCSIPAAMAATTCSYSPSSLSASGKTTLSITTTAPSAMIRYRIPPGSLLMLAVLLALTMAARRTRKPLAFAVLFSMLAAVALGACGGGGGGGGQTNMPPPSTPAGTYAVTIIANNGSVSSSTTVSVTVQ